MAVPGNSDLACQVHTGAGSDTGPGRESWRLQSLTVRGPRIVEDMSDMGDHRRVSTAPVAVAVDVASRFVLPVLSRCSEN
jgi:hypothetical protein